MTLDEKSEEQFQEPVSTQALRLPRKLTFKLNEEIFKDDKPCKKCTLLSPLLDSGLCLTCSQLQEREKELSRGRRSKLIEVLGGEYAVDHYSFETYRPATGNTEALAFAKSFNHKKDNCYFYGPCGSGKTHLALSIARQGILDNLSVMVKTPRQMVRSLRGKDPDEEERVIATYSRSDIVVLDEIGLGADTQFAIGSICEIIENRYRNNRNGLIFTSNYSIDELGQILKDDRVPSRIWEICKEFKVAPVYDDGKEIDWRSVRKRR